MRAEPTEAEAKLWTILRARRLAHLKFRRQVVFDGRYIADFVCFKHRLIVEADGSQHADSRTDTARDAWFRQQGFATLRYWNNEILGNPDGVATAILAAIDHPSPPAPLPQGERGKGAYP